MKIGTNVTLVIDADISSPCGPKDIIFRGSTGTIDRVDPSNTDAPFGVRFDHREGTYWFSADELEAD